jgi:hypothetical protein
METVNLQSSHIAQVVSSLISAASSLNVVATFLNAGIALTITEDRKLSYLVRPERKRCLMTPIVAAAEQARTEYEVEAFEQELI